MAKDHTLTVFLVMIYTVLTGKSGSSVGMFHPRNPVLVAEIDRKLRTKLAASVAYLADRSSRDAAPDAAHLATTG